MPTIRVRGHPKAFQAKITTSLLNVLVMNGFPIDTVCGGRAQCGRDLIRIVSGAEFLSPLREAERLRLESLAREGQPAGPGMRLACQCYARGDVEIEAINIRGKA
jgi:ferredoxin